MRFKKIEGIDYKRGASEYPNRLAPSDRHHLLTKPFYNLAHKHTERWTGEGLDEDSQRHFCDFANVAAALELPAGARILDVGCGSGWLCEYFARFGYDVTGIDISQGLIDFANERLGRVPFPVDAETPLRYRFLAHDIEAAALAETFDAVICYDALHHFEDEHAVLRHVAAMLSYGALLFIVEGEEPPDDSASAEDLRSVMRQYETLESPFSHEYLLSLVRENGFAVIGNYIAVAGLFDRGTFDSERILAERSAFNYLLCKKVADGPATMPDSNAPNDLRAAIRLRGEFNDSLSPRAPIACSVEVVNEGDTLWLVSRAAPKGTVRLGIKILDDASRIVDEFHGKPPLPHALAPGEKAVLEIDHPAPEQAGGYRLKIDLLDQDICWFEQRGSQPLVLAFRVV
jgi:2-polyprenyl-3-methyl-5-hydroxy-6-metoxy-1,4-benzoquinol methylase